MYVGRLPGRVRLWCWYVRVGPQLLAIGIADLKGQALARAENACDAWSDNAWKLVKVNG